ncbi:LysR family transcriptional regulator [Acinetobacter sp. ANC 4558]|uniref:LysR family transcriptional regulator n=1 Tax=Acinetobacter sp. ANC 4558 TaxID=1977876 RepID=UPI000A33FD10|nr:LysR family transcriptional regulator [Acinetobacter sp. ANC 4558]OTG87675.1 LysR family transcriptional regulator [Acinetobacter sp. ANC 4558]
MSCNVHKPEWISLVESRIEQLGSIQKVADELGYARTSLSLALRGKYIGSTERLERTVMKVLGSVTCPHLEKQISPDECISFRERNAPTQNPAEMRHWRACQQCPHACIRKRIT